VICRPWAGDLSLWSISRCGRYLANQPDVIGARALLAAADFELDHLTFAQLLEGDAFAFRMMEEQIAPVRFNESEPFFAQQLLDLTLWHNSTPLKHA
jgi:hypothetical protein